MQEAGADAVLECAFKIADGIEYCRTGILGVLLSTADIISKRLESWIKD